MPPKQKQALLDNVKKQMDLAGVPDAEQEEIIRPYLDLIGFDYYHNYISAMLNQLEKTSSGAVDSKLRNAAKGKIIELQNNFVFADDTPLSPDMLRKHMKDAIIADVFTPGEQVMLDKFSAYIEKLFASCLKRNGYTKDAITFISDFETAEMTSLRSNKDAISDFIAKHQD